MSKTLATKYVATVLVAAGLILGFSLAFAQPAKADSLSSLQAQVQALLAQIAALQGSSSTTTTTMSGSGCQDFTMNESAGMTGGQVMWIQQFLNGHGFTVATTGAGSPGNETSYFGPATKRAVIAFQNANAATVLTPVGLTAGTGYWGPSTRAEANAMCAGGTTTTTTTTTGTGTGTTVAGSVSVTAGTQPANSLAPALANRVPFTTFTLTNTSGAAVTINGVMVQRTGLAADAAFSGVELINQNGVQIGTSRTFNSNHQAEIGTPWTLNAGQSMTFTVAANMPGSGTLQNYAGQVAAISVVGIDTSVPVSGSLPITGAQQTINSSLVIGTATMQRSSYDPLTGRSEPIGTTGLIFSGVRLTAGSAENEKLYSITWNQTGSVGSNDLGNLVTVVNGTSYPMTADSSGKYFTATFPGGIAINEGQSVDAYVQGDIVGNDASGRTIEFDIYRQSDVYVVGQTYGYGITPTPSSVPANTTVQSGTTNGVPSWTSQFLGTGSGSTFASSQPFFEGAGVAVTAGTLSTISNAGTVSAQNIAVNVPNQPLGGFMTNFTGEPVQVQSLVLNVATSGVINQLKSVTIVDSNGNVVAGPVDQSGTTITFNTSITFPVGAMTYTIKGMVDSNAQNGATVQLSTNPNTNWSSPQGQTSGSTVSLPITTITMSTMTVQAGQLAVSAASTPSATTLAANSSNVVIANINLDASQSGEDIRLSALPVVIDATSTTDATTLKNGLTNCQLYNGSAALNTQAVGSNQWTAATVSTHTFAGFTSTAGLDANFVFQNAITIPKGTVVTLALECNVSGSLYSGIAFAAGVDSTQDTTTTLVPTGAMSGNTITTPLVATGNSVSGVMTVGVASLAVTVPTPVAYSQVAGGTTGVTVGTFTLQPTSDSVNLRYVDLGLNSNFASTSDILHAYVYNSANQQVGEANFTSSNTETVGGTVYDTASTTISSSNVPQGQTTQYWIKADIAGIGPSGGSNSGMSGHEIRIRMLNANGTGASSGTLVNSGSVAAPTTGIAIFRVFPTQVTANPNSFLPANGVADGRLIAFSVTASANSGNAPLGINQFTFSIATTSINTLSNLNLYAYTDSAFSQAAGGTNNGIAGSTFYNGVTQVATTTMSTPLEIPAGQTWYFLLKSTVSPAGTSYNIVTTLKGDTADLAPNLSTVSALAYPTDNFIWSPNSTTTSATANIDWTNGAGINGLPSSGIIQNRTQ